MSVENIKIVNALKDDSFNKEYSNNYVLNILLKNNLFAYNIFDSNTKNLLVFQKSEISASSSAVEALKHIFYEHDDLKLIYQNVHIGVYSSEVTIVPEGQFSSNGADEYIKLLFSTPEIEDITKDNIEVTQSVVVYSYNKNIADFFRSQFDKVTIKHSLSYLLEYLTKKNENCTINKVYLYVNEGEAEIVVFKKGKFHFYNTFTFRSDEDFIYYILLVYDQLKLDKYKDVLVLIGEIEKQSALYSILYKYVQEIRIGSRPSNYEYPEAFGVLPQHYYYNLFCM